MTIQEILTQGKRILESPCTSSSIDNPALDATLLLTEALNTRREELWIRGKETIEESYSRKYYDLLERRRGGECIAYILGHKEFRGLRFAVNPNVLVPRPDTETLVEAALEYIDTLRGTPGHTALPGSLSSGQGGSPRDTEKTEELSLLDLCTGSGILAVSLKNERPFLSVTASDISGKALAVAAQNAEQLLNNRMSLGTGFLDNPVRFIQGDLFENIRGKFHIIVSNPPYVLSEELKNLAPEVQREPKIALDGGSDGLDIMTRIIAASPRYLYSNGTLLLEAGSRQMPAIQAYLKTYGFGNIMVHRDIAGRDRVISAQI